VTQPQQSGLVRLQVPVSFPELGIAPANCLNAAVRSQTA
jgi:hypothetical protein